MSYNKERAVNSLTHYLKTAWEAAGLSWGDDNNLEVEQIVGDIIEEATTSTD